MAVCENETPTTFCLTQQNNSTFLSRSEKTVHHQQPSGNENLCTGNFCVIVCTASLMFTKIHATVSQENSLVTQPDLVLGSVSDINLKAKLT